MSASVGEVVDDAGTEPRGPAEPGGRQPALARDLERALESILVGVELGGWQRRGSLSATGEMAEADDRQVRRVDGGLEVLGVGAQAGEQRGVVVVCLDQPGEPVAAEMLPGHPELEGAPPSGALEAELVEVELAGVVVVGVDRRGLAAAVVLRRPAAEDLPEVLAAADQQPADVVRLEEPLVRVHGDRIGALQVRDPPRVTGGQPRRAAVGRVDVEPQVLGRGDVGQLPGGVDRPGVGRADDAGDRERRQSGGPISCDRLGDGRAAQPEPLVGRDDRPASRAGSRAGRAHAPIEKCVWSEV